jgi:hypothetical protein
MSMPVGERASYEPPSDSLVPANKTSNRSDVRGALFGVERNVGGANRVGAITAWVSIGDLEIIAVIPCPVLIAAFDSFRPN